MRRFLAALLVLLIAPALAQQPRSFLLVSKKGVVDPFFEESVVLVLDSAGPVGVILNKPQPRTVAYHFPGEPKLAGIKEPVYFGGPVEAEKLVFVFRAGQAPKHPAVEMLPGIYMSENVNLLRELLAREKPIEGLRVYAGRSGWAPKQLESEIDRGGWHILPADARYVFHRNPRSMWRELESRATSTQASVLESEVRPQNSGSGSRGELPAVSLLWGDSHLLLPVVGQ